MKKIHLPNNFIVICYATIIAFITGCNSDPKSDFAKKKKIGICEENQGMVTLEVNLYNDSTFYIAGNDLYYNFSFGEFSKRYDTIFFKTKGGDILLCKKYKFIKTILEPIDCKENKETLTINLKK